MTARPLETGMPFTVKTYDIDFAGIVSNIVYIRWLEDLRLQILADHYPLEAQLAQGTGPVLVKTEIVYRRPIRIQDRPTGRMWVESMGRAKWVLRAEFFVGEELAATAEQTGYFVAYDTMRPIPIPEPLREEFRRASAATQRN